MSLAVENAGIDEESLVSNTRVIMSVVSTLASLPDTHRLKNSLTWKLKALRQKRVPVLSSTLIENSVGIENSLWPSSSPQIQHSAKKTVNKVPPPFPIRKVFSSSLSLSKEEVESAAGAVRETLYELLADVLKVNRTVIAQEGVRQEIDFVFATWRRPQLLLGKS